MSENYYILLDLDSSENNWAVIEAAINSKSKQWSKETIRGANKERSQRYLNSTPDMRKELKDPQRRDEIRRAAKLEREQMRNQQLSELDKICQTRSEGRISNKGVPKLLAQVCKSISKSERARGIGETEVVACLESHGISVVDEADVKFEPTAIPKIDSSKARKLRKALDHVGKTSLYDFLGMDKNSTPSALHAAANRVYHEALNNANSENRATTQEIAGYGITCFANRTEKARYDNTLNCERMDELAGLLEAAGDDKRIDRHEVVQIVHAAQAINVPQELALNHIAEVCKKRKWDINPDVLTYVKEKREEVQRGTAPFRLSGTDYKNAEDLGRALAADWQDSVDAWQDPQKKLYHWIKDELGLKTVAQQLKDLENRRDLDLEAQVLSMVYALNPHGPLVYKDLELTQSNIQALASKAGKNDDAAVLLRDLHDRQILVHANKLASDPALTSIAAAWRQAVDEFESICQRFSDHMPKFEDRHKTILLAAATPGSAELEKLRTQAKTSATRDARACKWFRDLGNLSKAGPAVLLAAPTLARVAAAEVEEERRLRLSKRLATVAGGLVGFLTGAVATFIVLAIPIWIYTLIASGGPEFDSISGFFSFIGGVGGMFLGAFMGRSMVPESPLFVTVASAGVIALFGYWGYSYIVDQRNEAAALQFEFIEPKVAERIELPDGVPISPGTTFMSPRQGINYWTRYNNAIPDITTISIHLMRYQGKQYNVDRYTEVTRCTPFTTESVRSYMWCNLSNFSLSPGSYEFRAFAHAHGKRVSQVTKFVVRDAQAVLTKTVQRKLNQLGYKAGNADGIFGRRTSSAIRSFQRDRGYQVDGKVSDQLSRHLDSAIASKGAPKQVVRTENQSDTIVSVVRTNKRFSGRAGSGTRREWPFEITFSDYNPRDHSFGGQIEWPTLNGVTRISGSINGGTIEFTEIAHVRRGNVGLNTFYEITGSEGDKLTGRWNRLGSNWIWIDVSSASASR